MSKSLDNVLDPQADVICKFNTTVDAYRYFFLRECPFPGDGDYAEKRFKEVNNNDLANTLGNLLSRTITVPSKSLNGELPGTAGRKPEATADIFDASKLVAEVRTRLESCEYSQALQAVMTHLLYPANKYIGDKEPWKVVKADKNAAAFILQNVVESLRIAAILLKPFIPRSAEAIYKSFNFPTPWEEVKYVDAAELKPMTEDLRVTAELVDGKVKPLFPRLA